MDSNDRNQGQSGGVNITGGSVNAGGDIVGRDKITGISRDQLEQVFLPLVNAIQAAPPEKQGKAFEKAEVLKNEVAKGEGASDELVAKLLDGIVGLVPGAVTALVSVFATPILGGISGPVTKFVLDRFQGK